jgi:hypothetical protein
MALGSGLAHSFGFAPEATFGTYVAPTKWLEVQSTEIKKVKNTYQGGGMAAGRVVRAGRRRVVTSQAGAGPVKLEVPANGFGGLLNGLLGGTVAPVQQGATAAYLQSHPLVADQMGKRFTMQGGVPDLAGTVRPYTFLGSKITAMEFSCGINEPLTVTVDVDCRQVVESETLAAPSFLETDIFHFAQSAVLLGTYDAEAQVDGIRKMTLRIERPSRMDRFYHGNAGLKSEPVGNNWVAISGTIEADYLDKTVFADRFASDASTALIWRFTGPSIEAPYNELFELRVPMIFFDGDTPVVQGPDVVSGSFPWVAANDLDNVAVTGRIITSDATLI